MRRDRRTWAFGGVGDIRRFCCVRRGRFRAKSTSMWGPAHHDRRLRKRHVTTLFEIMARIWASPYSAAGLLLGVVVVLFGGHAVRRQGAIEIGGGAVGRFLARLPWPFAFSATLGHVILGLDHATLAAVRAHEQVHVRQYERWGPFFGPAYVLSSLIQLLSGRRPYLDNHFERQAYGRSAER